MTALGIFIYREDSLQGLFIGKQSFRLIVGQVVVLHLDNNILTDNILVGVFEDFFGWLFYQPPFEVLLLGKEFFIQCRVQFFVGHQRSSFAWGFLTAEGASNVFISLSF